MCVVMIGTRCIEDYVCECRYIFIFFCTSVFKNVWCTCVRSCIHNHDKAKTHLIITTFRGWYFDNFFFRECCYFLLILLIFFLWNSVTHKIGWWKILEYGVCSWELFFYINIIVVANIIIFFSKTIPFKW